MLIHSSSAVRRVLTATIFLIIMGIVPSFIFGTSAVAYAADDVQPQAADAAGALSYSALNQLQDAVAREQLAFTADKLILTGWQDLFTGNFSNGGTNVFQANRDLYCLNYTRTGCLNTPMRRVQNSTRGDRNDENWPAVDDAVAYSMYIFRHRHSGGQTLVWQVRRGLPGSDATEARRVQGANLSTTLSAVQPVVANGRTGVFRLTTNSPTIGLYLSNGQGLTLCDVNSGLPLTQPNVTLAQSNSSYWNHTLPNSQRWYIHNTSQQTGQPSTYGICVSQNASNSFTLTAELPPSGDDVEVWEANSNSCQGMGFIQQYDKISATVNWQVPTPTPTGGTNTTNNTTPTVPALANLGRDYGDAPASYGTAEHTIVDFLSIGVTTDSEAQSQHSATASGDDAAGDDEDGVNFVGGATGNIGAANKQVSVVLVNRSVAPDGSGRSNNGHGNNQDGVDVSNPGQGNGGPNGQVDPSGTVDDENRNGNGNGNNTGCGNGNSNNGHGNNQDGVDVSNPGQGNGGPNGQVDPSGTVDDENRNGNGNGNVNCVAPSAYLSIWIDFNRNGSFDGSEKIVSDHVVTSQPNAQLFTFPFNIPSNAVCGDTVARFRYGLTANGPTGSAATGEVEDHPFTIQCIGTNTTTSPTTTPTSGSTPSSTPTATPQATPVTDLSVTLAGPPSSVNPFVSGTAEAVAWRVNVANVSGVGTQNVRLDINMPTAILYNSWSASAPGWNCTHNPLSSVLSCQRASLAANTAAPSITVNTSVPPSANVANQRMTLTAWATSDGEELNTANNTDSAFVDVLDVWTISPGSGRLFTHARFNEALDAAEGESDYQSNEYVINHIQVPIALGFGFDASQENKPPVLCLTYTENNECPVLYAVPGVMRVKFYTVTGLIDTASGTNLMAAPITVNMHDRLASTSSAVCSGSRCVAYHSHLNPFQWEADEYVHFNFVTNGGRATSCTAASEELCVTVTSAKPGVYEVHGTVQVEAFFKAGTHPSLTSDVTKSYTLQFVTSIKIVAPFVQPESSGN